MRGHGARIAAVAGVGFVAANLVAIVATVAWVGSGAGSLTSGGLLRSTVTTTLVATFLGAAVAGFVARHLLPSVTTTARMATAGGAAVYAVATGLLLIFGGALAAGLVGLVVGPMAAAGTAVLVMRPPARHRA